MACLASLEGGDVSEEETVGESNWGRTGRAAGALIGLLLGFALGLIITWIYWVGREEQPEAAPSRAVEEERLTLEPRPRDEGAECLGEVEPDDLTRVEGIGPKTSGLLQEAGIVTFQQLAGRDPDALREMLREEGLPFIDPGTWPEQAALAAVGAWEELEALQEQLSGGRRV